MFLPNIHFFRRPRPKPKSAPEGHRSRCRGRASRAPRRIFAGPAMSAVAAARQHNEVDDVFILRLRSTVLPWGQWNPQRRGGPRQERESGRRAERRAGGVLWLRWTRKKAEEARARGRSVGGGGGGGGGGRHDAVRHCGGWLATGERSQDSGMSFPCPGVCDGSASFFFPLFQNYYTLHRSARLSFGPC